MARYPVTIAQFQAFVEDCYRDGRWRLPLGSQRIAWEDPPTHRARHGNHPADNVELVRCQGLLPLAERTSRRRGPAADRVRVAARRHRRRPRKDLSLGPRLGPRAGALASQYLGERAGALDSGRHVPGRCLQAGVLDMAGTLWEWCPNTHDDPDRTDSTRLKPRVLRGGSWNHIGASRAAPTAQALPGLRGYGFGFRVVCCPPSRIADH